jgi:hypothetical protein
MDTIARQKQVIYWPNFEIRRRRRRRRRRIPGRPPRDYWTDTIVRQKTGHLLTSVTRRRRRPARPLKRPLDG